MGREAGNGGSVFRQQGVGLGGGCLLLPSLKSLVGDG